MTKQITTPTQKQLIKTNYITNTKPIKPIQKII